jgi:hypothetical protein
MQRARINMKSASQYDCDFGDLTLHLIRSIALTVQAGIDGDIKKTRTNHRANRTACCASMAFPHSFHY